MPSTPIKTELMQRDSQLDYDEMNTVPTCRSRGGCM